MTLWFKDFQDASLIGEQNDSSNSESLCHSLPIKFHLNLTYGLRGDVV